MKYKLIKIKNYILYFIIFIIIIYLCYIFLKTNITEKEYIYIESFNNQENNNAYIINLDERNDRIEQMKSDFINSPFQLIQYPAVKMNPPQEGCARSYVNLVKVAKEKGLPTILILEDDNKPEPYYAKNWLIIKQYLDSHLDDWEIFNGGLFGLSLIQEKVDLENDIKLIKTNGGYLTTWIYINSKAYDKVLQWETLGKPLIDLWFSSSFFNFWCCYPLLSFQHNGYSDIDKSIKNHPEEKMSTIQRYKELLFMN